MYSLSNSFAQDSFVVAVVGTGGTGGYVAESLCRMLPPRALVLLIDPDRVEERNLSRQNFIKRELGQFKSEALALRLSSMFNRAVAYKTVPVSACNMPLTGLVIGCVDNGPARKDIQRFVNGYNSGYRSYRPVWWIDSGNGDSYGQIVIGNGTDTAFKEDSPEVCVQLPYPILQLPDLLKQVPQQPSCAQNEEQSPTINLVMAAMLTEVVRRTIDGNCPWSQLYMDLNAGSMTAINIQPGRKGKKGGVS